MYDLLESMYSAEKITQIELLYSDSDVNDQFLIRASIANALKDHPPSVLKNNGTDWILCTLALHKKSPEDTMRVLQSILRFLRFFDFGMVDITTKNIEFKDTPLIADTCLVGIGFFRERMERMHKRKAAPSVDYYTEAGRLAFIRTGYESIGEDFCGWTSFIEKEFIDN